VIHYVYSVKTLPIIIGTFYTALSLIMQLATYSNVLFIFHAIRVLTVNI